MAGLYHHGGQRLHDTPLRPPCPLCKLAGSLTSGGKAFRLAVSPLRLRSSLYERVAQTRPHHGAGCGSRGWDRAHLSLGRSADLSVTTSPRRSQAIVRQRGSAQPLTLLPLDCEECPVTLGYASMTFLPCGSVSLSDVFGVWVRLGSPQAHTIKVGGVMHLDTSVEVPSSPPQVCPSPEDGRR